MKYFAVLLILIGFSGSAYAQYMGDKYPAGTLFEECIGGQGMCPEQQLKERLENDQKNALFVTIIGIPSFVALVFLIWRKRK